MKAEIDHAKNQSRENASRYLLKKPKISSRARTQLHAYKILIVLDNLSLPRQERYKPKFGKITRIRSEERNRAVL